MAACKALLFLCCVAAAFATESDWDGMRVRWTVEGLMDPTHATALFDMPKTVSDAMSQSWVAAVDSNVDSSAASIVTTYCMEDDPRVCMLYDSNGVAAGIDVSMLVSDVSGLNINFDWDSQELFVKMERFGYPIYRTRVFWVSEEEVEQGRSTWENGLGSGLWFEGKSGRIQIPINQADIESETLYVRQFCIPAMGLHYFYNMSEEADCSQLYPFFLLLDKSSGKLLGVGFYTFGISSEGNRTWFESFDISGVRAAIPNFPNCLLDWGAQVGLTALHMFFRDNELAITC